MVIPAPDRRITFLSVHVRLLHMEKSTDADCVVGELVCREEIGTYLLAVNTFRHPERDDVRRRVP